MQQMAEVSQHAEPWLLAIHFWHVHLSKTAAADHLRAGQALLGWMGAPALRMLFGLVQLQLGELSRNHQRLTPGAAATPHQKGGALRAKMPQLQPVVSPVRRCCGRQRI